MRRSESVAVGSLFGSPNPTCPAVFKRSKVITSTACMASSLGVDGSDSIASVPTWREPMSSSGPLGRSFSVGEVPPLNKQTTGGWKLASEPAVADVCGIRCVDHSDDLQLDARRQHLEQPTARHRTAPGSGESASRPARPPRACAAPCTRRAPAPSGPRRRPSLCHRSPGGRGARGARCRHHPDAGRPPDGGGHDSRRPADVVLAILVQLVDLVCMLLLDAVTMVSSITPVSAVGHVWSKIVLESNVRFRIS